MPRKPPVKKTAPKPMGVQNTDADLDALLEEGVPELFEPGYEAHRLRMAGTPWPEVAKAIGSPSSMAAMNTVSRYLQKAAKSQSMQHMQEALQTQVDRYEQILQSWWQAATVGKDEKAALVVLRTMERLDRVLRLTDGDIVVSKETLVVSADPASYVKQLQSVVSDRADRADTRT